MRIAGRLTVCLSGKSYPLNGISYMRWFRMSIQNFAWHPTSPQRRAPQTYVATSHAEEYERSSMRVKPVRFVSVWLTANGNHYLPVPLRFDVCGLLLALSITLNLSIVRSAPE